MAVNQRLSYTVPGSALVSLIEDGKKLGVELLPSLRGRGLTMDEFKAPDARVPVELYESLWEVGASLLGSSDFGLKMATCLTLDSFHLVGHVAAACSTVGEAIDRVVDLSRLLHDAGRTEVERVDHQRVRLFPGCRGLQRPPPRAISEFNTASAIVLIRILTRRPEWLPLEVHFSHEAPARMALHQELFGVTPVFHAVETMVVLSNADLSMPVRAGVAPQIGEYLESYAQTLIAQLSARHVESLRDRILSVIVSNLSTATMTLEGVAARLAMTPRTLQRRLAKSGKTFSVLVDEARMVAAERYLADENLSLGEISFLLGYKEPSTFHKAFRRLKGVSPGTWRSAARPKR